MEFQPLYFREKLNPLADPPNPENGRLNIVNPRGHSALVTLWSKIAGNGGFWEKIRTSRQGLLNQDSPLAVVSNLYGNGLPQMLANLAYNPQIERIAVSGGNASGSAEALANFFSNGVREESVGGLPMLTIEGTQFPLPKELHPNNFRYQPEIVQFNPGDLEGICNFISQPARRAYQESDRAAIDLPKPVFKDFPSDITFHNVSAGKPLEAWMEVMYLLDRFGVNLELTGEKGKRRALFNLDVNVADASFENEDDLRKFGYNPDELKAYRQTMIDPTKQADKTYTYGNRMREYFGIDALKVCGERLRANPMDRHSLVSLWDTSKDLTHQGADSSSPCFTDAYFDLVNGKLMMTAHFRTHNAVSAWLTNLYGLRAIQEKVSEYSGIEPGQLNVRSRWVGIDPENAKTVKAQELIKANRKSPLEVDDPRGYFVTEVKEDQIVIGHYSPKGVLLREYAGNPKEIKDGLRLDRAISDADHAFWVGYNAAKAEFDLTGKVAGF
ncbi:MAG: hypothetical protein Q8Q31_05825 [Nanoarchaeota archaeon]|nr:hypothetical protein [Nanoarchaeota archaeon]